MVVPVNFYVLFELPEKPALESGLPPLQPQAYLCQTSSNPPCPFLGQAGPWLSNGKREKWQVAKSVKNVFLRTARQQTVSSPGYYCLSYNIKMPGVGTGSRKFSCRKLIHGEKLKREFQLPASVSIVGFCWRV